MDFNQRAKEFDAQIQNRLDTEEDSMNMLEAIAIADFMEQYKIEPKPGEATNVDPHTIW